ncbi:MAG: hypothetical protein ACK53L_19530, partial [Pirellulaceae bacterium]
MSPKDFLIEAKKAIYDPLIAGNVKIIRDEILLCHYRPPSKKLINSHNSTAVNNKLKNIGPPLPSTTNKTKVP